MKLKLILIAGCFAIISQSSQADFECESHELTSVSFTAERSCKRYVGFYMRNEGEEKANIYDCFNLDAGLMGYYLDMIPSRCNYNWAPKPNNIPSVQIATVGSGRVCWGSGDPFFYKHRIIADYTGSVSNEQTPDIVRPVELVMDILDAPRNPIKSGTYGTEGEVGLTLKDCRDNEETSLTIDFEAARIFGSDPIETRVAGSSSSFNWDPYRNDTAVTVEEIGGYSGYRQIDGWKKLAKQNVIVTLRFDLKRLNIIDQSSCECEDGSEAHHRNDYIVHIERSDTTIMVPLTEAMIDEDGFATIVHRINAPARDGSIRFLDASVMANEPGDDDSGDGYGPTPNTNAEPSADLGSMIWSLPLGPNVQDETSLSLKRDSLAGVPFDTAFFNDFANKNFVTVLYRPDTGELGQVFGGAFLADINFPGPDSITIDVYRTSDPVYNPNTDLYETTDLPLVRTITIGKGALADGSVRFTNTAGSIITVEEFQHDVVTDKWALVEADGLRVTRLTETPDGSDTIRLTEYFSNVSDIATVLTIATSPDQKIEETVRTDDFDEEILLARKVYSDDTNFELTQYTYDGSERLTKVKYPNGSWMINQYSGVDSQPIARFDSYLDLSDEVPTEPYDYNALARTATVTRYDLSSTTVNNGANPYLEQQMTTEVSVPRETSPGSYESTVVSTTTTTHRVNLAAGTRTITTTRSSTAGDEITTTEYFGEDLRFVTYPDGTQEKVTEDDIVTVIERGEFDSSDPLNNTLINGQKTTIIASGALRSEQIDAVRGGVVSSVSIVDQTLDELDRPLSIDYHDGTSESYTYGDFGVVSMTDRLGNVTQYTYDALGRLATELSYAGSSNSQMIAYSYDGANRITSLSEGPDAGSLTDVITYSYRMDGERTNVRRLFKDALQTQGEVSSRVIGSDGFTTRTISYPNGGTLSEVTYPDGQYERVTGTANTAMRYEYGVENSSDLGYFVRTVITITLKPGADDTWIDTGEWSKSYIDAFGRTYLTEQPAADGGGISRVREHYNDKNQLWKEVDVNGVATVYEYDGLGDLVGTAIDVDNDATETSPIEYIGDDRVTKRITTYTTKQVDEDTFTVRRVSDYVYDDTGEVLVRQTDTSLDDPTGGDVPRRFTWSTTFLANPGDPANPHEAETIAVEAIDADNRTRTVTVTYPDGTASRKVYTGDLLMSATLIKAGGSFDTVEDKLSEVTYTYDALRRMASATQLREGTTIYTYFADGQVKSVTTPDPDGVGPASAESTLFDFAYWGDGTNILGIRSTQTLPDASTVIADFDAQGRLIFQSGSGVVPAAYSYDFAGRLKTLTTWQDLAGNSGSAMTVWAYNDAGLPSQKWYDATIDDETGAISGTAGPTYSYLPGGLLSTITDARGIVTTYTYALGQELQPGIDADHTADLLAIDYSDATDDVALAYNRLGLPNSITDAAGTRTLSYRDGRLASEAYTAGPLTGHTLDRLSDGLGRLTGYTLSNASTTLASASYAYHGTAPGEDGSGRLRSVTSGDAVFTYDFTAQSSALSTRTATIAGTERLATSYQWDFRNRLTQLTNTANGSTSLHDWTLGYNARDLVESVDAGNTSWQYGYDEMNQITSAVRQDDASATALPGYDFSYAFDDVGNRQSLQREGASASYTANALNQYTSIDPLTVGIVLGETNADSMTVTVGDGPALPAGVGSDGTFGAVVPYATAPDAGVTDYTLTGTLIGGGDAGTDAVNRLQGSLFFAGAPVTPTYDANGNLTSDARWTYRWDANNRLSEVAAAPGAVAAGAADERVSYRYDLQGRMVSRMAYLDGTLVSTESYLWEAYNPIAKLDSGLSLVQAFVWGIDMSGTFQGAGGVGGLLLVEAGPACYVPAYDHRGNVVDYLDAADGSTVASFAYGPFGETLRETGPKADELTYRFSTKPTDPTTKFIHYELRTYDPTEGRWLSRDPIGEAGGLNLYGFVGNDPVNEWDLLGMIDHYFRYGMMIFHDDGAIVDENFSRKGMRSGVRYGRSVSILFKPNDDCVPCRSIKMIQIVRVRRNGEHLPRKGQNSILNELRTTQGNETAGDYYVDFRPDRVGGVSPYYQDQYKYSLTNKPGRHPSSSPLSAGATMTDGPSAILPSDAANIQQKFDFETCAMCITNGSSDGVLGCVIWGFEVNIGSDKMVSNYARPPSFSSSPSATFRAAVINFVSATR